MLDAASQKYERATWLTETEPQRLIGSNLWRDAFEIKVTKQMIRKKRTSATRHSRALLKSLF